MTESFQDHFSSLAARYADFRPHYPRELFDYLAGVAPRRGLAWDCACGSGQASVDLAERFERVIATDGSAEQIKVARAHPRVEYRVAPAEASGIASGLGGFDYGGTGVALV
jgi:2-polyprenyl-3-methyl-5-hydroxy-6-metoxy-1,4-benzoquinol methylase